jgi:hypothetical protein
MFAQAILDQVVQDAIGRGRNHLAVRFQYRDTQQPVMGYRSLVLRNIEPCLIRIEIAHPLSFADSAAISRRYRQDIIVQGVVCRNHPKKTAG